LQPPAAPPPARRAAPAAAPPATRRAAVQYGSYDWQGHRAGKLAWQWAHPMTKQRLARSKKIDAGKCEATRLAWSYDLDARTAARSRIPWSIDGGHVCHQRVVEQGLAMDARDRAKYGSSIQKSRAGTRWPGAGVAVILLRCVV